MYIPVVSIYNETLDVQTIEGSKNNESIVKTHPLKRKESIVLNYDEKSKNYENRSNLKTNVSTTNALLEMLKSHAGIKDCTEETTQNINEVCVKYKRKKYKF